MAEYIPTPGPLEGEQFIPSNSDEGYSFIEEWCTNCARDKALREGVELDECDDDEKCEIVAASFRGEAVEWRELPDGSVKCVAFVAAGERIPPQRCPHTAELPLEPAAGVPASDNTALIAAAEKYADNYEGESIPAQDVRASIQNAFFAGSAWAGKAGAKGPESC